MQLYKGLAEVYPPEYDASQVMSEHSGKLAVLSSLLRSMYNATPRQRVVLVSNYTQVSMPDRVVLVSNYTQVSLPDKVVLVSNYTQVSMPDSHSSVYLYPGQYAQQSF